MNNEIMRILRKQLLKIKPEERIQLKEVRKHPWIVKNADKNEEYMKYWKEVNQFLINLLLYKFF